MSKAMLALTLLAIAGAAWWWLGASGGSASLPSPGAEESPPPTGLSAAQLEKRLLESTPKQASNELGRRLVQRLKDLEGASPEEIREALSSDDELRRTYLMTHTGAAAIDFFGRVVDQAGVAVSGATVDWHVPGGYLSEGAGQGRVITDEEGQFSVLGKSGAHIRIKSIAKAGYEVNLHQQNTTFDSYARFDDSEMAASTSAQHPRVFVAWNASQAPANARTLKGGGSYSVVPDGQWYTLDLAASPGRRKHKGRTAGGYVQLRMVRSGSRSDDAHASWQIDLEVPQGGIQLADGVHTYEAPEGGYSPGILLSSATATGTTPGGWRHFLVRRDAPSREYGRFSLKFAAFNFPDKVMLTVDYAFSSTRTLEPLTSG